MVWRARVASLPASPTIANVAVVLHDAPKDASALISVLPASKPAAAAVLQWAARVSEDFHFHVSGGTVQLSTDASGHTVIAVYSDLEASSAAASLLPSPSQRAPVPPPLGPPLARPRRGRQMYSGSLGHGHSPTWYYPAHSHNPHSHNPHLHTPHTHHPHHPHSHSPHSHHPHSHSPHSHSPHSYSPHTHNYRLMNVPAGNLPAPSAHMLDVVL